MKGLNSNPQTSDQIFFFFFKHRLKHKQQHTWHGVAWRFDLMRNVAQTRLEASAREREGLILFTLRCCGFNEENKISMETDDRMLPNAAGASGLVFSPRCQNETFPE